MEAPIVTLTTDWGDRDFYAAKVKGKLYSQIEGVRVVDLTHRQVWNDLSTAMNVIKHGCMSFPSGTVHIVDVGCEQAQGSEPERLSFIASYRGQYFICSNRKLIEVSLDNECDAVVGLPFPEVSTSNSFLAYDQYCDIAAALVGGADIHTLGKPCESLRFRSFLKAQVDGNRLESMVIYMDSYGNVDLNITFDEFEKIRAGRRFRVELDRRLGSNERYEDISSVSRHYSDVRMGELLLTVSSTGFLQLAVNKDSASKLLGLSYASRCRFVFLD